MVGRLVAPSAYTNGGDDGATFNGNLPPPSTIAAQLVRNHAESARGNRPADTTATFRQLLQEILNKTSAAETDPEVNLKLVKVVAEAGLDVLFHENPFAQWDVLLPQASDSLAVIGATIRQQPEILFLSDSQSSKAYHRPHLLLWLLPKIISLSCHAKIDQLQDPLKSLLCCMVTNLSRTLDMWQHAHALIETLRDCVDDSLFMLQKIVSFNHPKASHNTPLPPARSLARLWSETQQEVALPSGCQIQIRDANSAGKIPLFLLLVLRELRNTGDSSTNIQQATTPLQGWMLDTESSLARLILLHRSWFARDNLFSFFAVHILQLRRISLVAHSTINESVSYGLGLVLGCSADFLMAGLEDPLPADVQKELASTLSGVLGITDRSSDVTIAEEILLPALKLLVSEEKRYQSCHGDLRQEVNMWLTKLQSQVLELSWVTAAVRQQGEDHIMLDADQQTGVGSKPSIRGGGGPQNYSKLRKLRLRLHDDQTTKAVPYAEILCKIVDMLGKQNGGGITGLHQKAT